MFPRSTKPSFQFKVNRGRKKESEATNSRYVEFQDVVNKNKRCPSFKMNRRLVPKLEKFVGPLPYGASTTQKVLTFFRSPVQIDRFARVFSSLLRGGKASTQTLFSQRTFNYMLRKFLRKRVLGRRLFSGL